MSVARRPFDWVRDAREIAERRRWPALVGPGRGKELVTVSRKLRDRRLTSPEAER